MAEKQEPFRLRRLLDPGHLAARVKEIRSPADAVRRAANVPVYLFHRILNACYRFRGGIAAGGRRTTSWILPGSVARFRSAASRAGCAIAAGKRLMADITEGARRSVGCGAEAVKRRSARMLSGSLELVACGFGAAAAVIENTMLRAHGLRPSLTHRASTWAEARWRSAASRFERMSRELSLRRKLWAIRNAPPEQLMPEPDPPPQSMMRVLWMLHIACNYTCEYCFQLNEKKTTFVRRPIEEYAGCWESFNQVCGPAAVEVMGGEPFVFPGFLDILEVLCRENIVSISTNLYWNPEMVIGRFEPARLYFVVSYHPDHEPSVEKFIAKAVALREAGFSVIARIVAYPPLMTEIPGWLDAFYQKGIYVILSAYDGFYERKHYPESYDALDWEIIRGTNTKKYMFKEIPKTYAVGPEECLSFAADFQSGTTSPKGKLCNAGMKYCRILFNGDIVRCGQESDKVGPVLGNFFEKDFRPLKRAAPCPFEACNCIGENAYMEGGPLGPSLEECAAQRVVDPVAQPAERKDEG